MSAPLDPDRNFWHFIATEVVRYREQHGEKGMHLAASIQVDRSTVSRIQSGGLHLSEEIAEKLDEHWDTDGRFVRLVRFAQEGDDNQWFEGLAAYERLASRFRVWELALVPGLLQTPDYARAALSIGLMTGVEKAVETRLKRQTAVFDKPNPARFSAILNWFILEEPLGSDEVMRGQLAHLLELSERPDISIRVIERGKRGHVGLDGPFHLLTVEDKDIAFEDAAERGRLVLSPTGAQSFAVRYDRLSDIAAPVDVSRTLIRRAMESFK
ncbi:DUF5753 domain-containing protein [Actinomadura atramentaria]|uniref:DUF5753 domain-containing protein n=1 Tax=Actinomadura atramentaria TaxID=1990 RepID=UPI0012FA2C14|nr:DUF5753 domain-containing protein [Actinomadura atramentaria]